MNPHQRNNMADMESQFIRYTPSYPEKLLIFEKKLPLPPSMNAMYGYSSHTGKPYLKKEVGEYRHKVRCLIGVFGDTFKHTRYEDRIALEVYVTAPDNVRRDMDNLAKVLQDALTKAGVWKDDYQVDDIRIRRAAPNKADPHVFIRVYRLCDIKTRDWEIMKNEGFYQLNGEPYVAAPKKPRAKKVSPSPQDPAALPE